jgi:hypothetical protein
MFVRKLGLKITSESAAIISSGIRCEDIAMKTQNREEGELSDSEDESDSDSEDDDDTTGNSFEAGTVQDLDTSGSITDSDDGEMLANEPESEHGSTKKCKLKKKYTEKKSKHSKKRKKSSKDKDSKSSRCKHKSKSYSMSTKLKKRALSRSRSRSYSVMRTFDEARGVWRMKKPDQIKARLAAQSHLKACTDLRIQIDKARLREIALMNAYKNMKSGLGPRVSLRATEISRLLSRGKTVEELTDFCKSMVRTGEDSAYSDSDDEASNSRLHHALPSDDESDDAMILRSRCLLRDANIVMNIRNARQIPILSKEEKAVQAAILLQNFPVSSGMQHRVRESEWQPVEKPMPPSAPATAVPNVMEEKPKPEVTCGVNIKNIGQIVTERLNALRQLSADPSDAEAMSAAYHAEQKLQQWAASKQNDCTRTLPAGAQVRMPRTLVKPAVFSAESAVVKSSASSASLSGAPASAPAEASFIGPMKPVDVHIGKLLLQKMGWKEGEGLGKDSSGPTAPLILDMKKDRKGLAWDDPASRLPPQPLLHPQLPTNLPPGLQRVARMHPLSALNELCFRKRWTMPSYKLIEDSGPAHRRTFRFKVTVNGVEYQPVVGNTNKKSARIDTAMACLQELANAGSPSVMPNVFTPRHRLPPPPLLSQHQQKAFPLPQHSICNFPCNPGAYDTPVHNCPNDVPFSVSDMHESNLCVPPLPRMDSGGFVAGTILSSVTIADECSSGSDAARSPTLPGALQTDVQNPSKESHGHESVLGEGSCGEDQNVQGPQSLLCEGPRSLLADGPKASGPQSLLNECQQSLHGNGPEVQGSQSLLGKGPQSLCLEGPRTEGPQKSLLGSGFPQGTRNLPRSRQHVPFVCTATNVVRCTQSLLTLPQISPTGNLVRGVTFQRPNLRSRVPSVPHVNPFMMQPAHGFVPRLLPFLHPREVRPTFQHYPPFRPPHEPDEFQTLPIDVNIDFTNFAVDLDMDCGFTSRSEPSAFHQGVLKKVTEETNSVDNANELWWDQDCKEELGEEFFSDACDPDTGFMPFTGPTTPVGIRLQPPPSLLSLRPRFSGPRPSRGFHLRWF